MRPRIIHELGLDSFEFSTAYLQFWDKLEKSNLYLEAVIEMRETDPLDREWQLHNEDGWRWWLELCNRFNRKIWSCLFAICLKRIVATTHVQ